MFHKHRLEALSDAVFAIVMTLLVLDLKVPTDVAAGGLGAALMHDSNAWFSFALTFTIAAIFWTLQHHVFDAIESTGREELIPTFFFLGFVSLLPFSTSLIGQHGSMERLAFVLYFANQFAIAASLTLKMELAHLSGRLHETADARTLRFRLYRIAAIMGAAAVGAHFLSRRNLLIAPVLAGIIGRIIQLRLYAKRKHQSKSPSPK